MITIIYLSVIPPIFITEDEAGYARKNGSHQLLPLLIQRNAAPDDRMIYIAEAGGKGPPLSPASQIPAVPLLRFAPDSLAA